MTLWSGLSGFIKARKKRKTKNLKKTLRSAHVFCFAHPENKRFSIKRSRLSKILPTAETLNESYSDRYSGSVELQP